MACDQPFRRWADLRPTLELAEPTTDDQRAWRDFLEEAERAGFRPRVDDGWGAFDAQAEPRDVFIVRRMREATPAGRQQRWELMLCSGGEVVASGFVLGFSATATLALEWLRGADEEAVWTRLAAISHHRTRSGASIEAAEPAGDAASSFRSGPPPPGVN